jgi:hypothetical protein
VNLFGRKTFKYPPMSAAARSSSFSLSSRLRRKIKRVMKGVAVKIIGGDLFYFGL